MDLFGGIFRDSELDLGDLDLGELISLDSSDISTIIEEVPNKTISPIKSEGLDVDVGYGQDVSVERYKRAQKTRSETSSEVGSKQSERERNLTDNAERCRRHRMKKKTEEEEIQSENRRLKRERAELLSTISDLEFEVQTLRGQGVMDLTKENDLLRAEIKKHRKYIERVVDVTLSTPLETNEVETTRLMKSGIESGIGQIVGLAYSSMNDPSWKDAQPFHLNTGDAADADGIIRIKYQLLPLGSTVAEAKRMNMRVDHFNVPISAAKVEAYIHKMFCDVNHIREMAKANIETFHKIPIEFEITEVFPKKKLEDDEEILCARIRIRSDHAEPKKEQIFMSSSKHIDVFSGAFRPDTSDAFPPERVKIVVSTNCHFVPVPLEEDIERIRELTVKGMLVRSGDDGYSHLTNIGSVPLCNGLTNPMFSNKPIINDDGEVSEDYKSVMRMQIRLSMEEMNKL